MSERIGEALKMLGVCGAVLGWRAIESRRCRGMIDLELHAVQSRRATRGGFLARVLRLRRRPKGVQPFPCAFTALRPGLSILALTVGRQSDGERPGQIACGLESYARLYNVYLPLVNVCSGFSKEKIPRSRNVHAQGTKRPRREIRRAKNVLCRPVSEDAKTFVALA